MPAVDVEGDRGLRRRHGDTQHRHAAALLHHVRRVDGRQLQRRPGQRSEVNTYHAETAGKVRGRPRRDAGKVRGRPRRDGRVRSEVSTGRAETAGSGQEVNTDRAETAGSGQSSTQVAQRRPGQVRGQHRSCRDGRVRSEVNTDRAETAGSGQSSTQVAQRRPGQVRGQHRSRRDGRVRSEVSTGRAETAGKVRGRPRRDGREGQR